MSMSEYIEITLRIVLGLQMTFWGLNGFFNWVTIPPSGPVIDRFVQSCIDSVFIMPTVKMIEIVCGAMLVLGLYVPLNLMVLGPIVFIVGGLHMKHNPKPASVIFPICLPFTILVIMHLADYQFLFN